ncbi:hypothetical protein HUG10_09640 [Halorarum halophilum]|uniref:Uncharacterized protein n=1 Tax=Halorarum halophilum TaxID=2743090 RepID=A0A7D5KDX2_9EURY|nr:hypothetical protein [Halobaculum halophilum]QLG27797.1 hypothetical protein HUG10_09640 [Halobaculum halophilum]
MVPDPSRRAVLAALAGLAGCTGTQSAPSPSRTEPSPTRPGTANDTVTTTRGTTDLPDPTATADPPGESRFADRPCPPMLDGCYHRATAETPVFVHPSAEEVELDGTVELSLVNRSDGSVFFGPYYWTVWREDDDGWTNVDPRDAVEDLGAEIEPGGTYTWTVPVEVGDGGADTAHRAAGGVDFEPGLHCFGVRDVPLSGDEDAEKGTPGALFEVV